MKPNHGCETLPSIPDQCGALERPWSAQPPTHTQSKTKPSKTIIYKDNPLKTKGLLAVFLVLNHIQPMVKYLICKYLKKGPYNFLLNFLLYTPVRKRIIFPTCKYNSVNKMILCGFCPTLYRQVPQLSLRNYMDCKEGWETHSPLQITGSSQRATTTVPQANSANVALMLQHASHYRRRCTNATTV